MFAIIFTLILSTVHCSVLRSKDFYPDRETILQNENSMFLGADLILNPEEQIVNYQVMVDKTSELDTAFQDSYYPPSQSFFKTKPLIEESAVFEFIKNMPKGGALHTHDTSIASIDWVISDITYRDNLYICEDNNVPHFAWFNNPNADTCSNWKAVSERREEVGAQEFDGYLKRLLTINVDDPEITYPVINSVWNAMSLRFVYISEILNYEPAFRDYFRHALEEFLSDNVQYMEVRTVLNEGVCRNLDTCDALSQFEIAQLYQEVADEFYNDHQGETCGAKMIFAPSRKVSNEKVDEYFELAEQILDQLPNTFAGFDLVGQEDLGRPLIDFADQIINASIANEDMKFFFHAGETNWQGQTTDINIIDALLLGAKRIGHGYAIVKHPEAMKLAKANDVPIEVCPISNQVLGLVHDLRNHPASPLIQQGFPLVISSDDPAIWQASGLSYDFYEAFMALASKDMDLRLLKKLVFSSISYSSLSSSDKNSCQTLVENKWNDYIQDFLKKNNILQPEIEVIH